MITLAGCHALVGHLSKESLTPSQTALVSMDRVAFVRV